MFAELSDSVTWLGAVGIVRAEVTGGWVEHLYLQTQHTCLR